MSLTAEKSRRQLADLKLNAFKNSMQNGMCPFCGKELRWYDGCLGYEAYRCYDCHFIIDHFGIHLEDE
jgi:tRNA(Ile2) C34 agmatinyltransferase TiaS